MTFIPLHHLKVRHNYTGTKWQDFTGDLAGAQFNLREMPGTHTAMLSFYNSNMDPSQSSGTRVIKKGDKVKVWMENGSSTWRKTATFTVKKVDVAPKDFTKPVGRQSKVTVSLLGNGVAGVAGTG